MTSFRTRLLSGFLGFYVLAGIGCISLIVADSRENLEQLSLSNKKWIQTYAETFLGDIETGNTMAVQNKLEILIQRDLLRGAVLKFGGHELRPERAGSEYQKWGSRSEEYLAEAVSHLLPRSQIAIDVVDSNETIWGNLVVDLDPVILHGPIIHSIEKLIIYGGAFFLICLSLILLFADALTDRVHSLIGYIQTFSRVGFESDGIRALLEDAPHIDVRELDVIVKEFSASIANVLRLEEEMKKNRVDAAIGNIAQQVAHDIRSPLAALEVAAGNVSQLPENKRILIRSAVGRIRDIANSLLDKNRATVVEAPSFREAASAQLLSSLIESLVTEKRLQFRSRSRVDIEAWLDASSYGIFAQVQPVEFKRLLSNLVDNAVEVFGDGPGVVRVNLSARDGRAQVSVHDNGKGISPEVVVTLGQRGETHGKAGGSGLGLYHARTSAESWGGDLKIASEVGKGTTITVALPQATSPDWFVSEVALVTGQAVVILDDDMSIHQVWQGRFGATSERDIEVIHVSTPGEIRAWVKANEKAAHDALYLLDYELLGYQDTGLSLAEELGIGERAILVTSRYEELGVVEGCRRLKARMIPKGLAGLVPVRVTQERVDGAESLKTISKDWDAILIDDDPLVRETWQVAADLAQKRLRVFSSAQEFVLAAGTFGRNTPVYVDATLGNNSRGEDESRIIHAMGFAEIYLATGQKAEEFSAYTHLRGVVGKSPPWA